ncbi:MAG: hypothetical protein WDZ49_13665 [Litorilinea sp.]
MPLQSTLRAHFTPHFTRHAPRQLTARRQTRATWRNLALWSIVLSACWGLAACSSAPATPTVNVPETIVLENTPGGTCGIAQTAGITGIGEMDDEAQIRALIAAEGQFVVAREIGPLMALWAEDSQIINAKNTPDDQRDDQIWRGTDAIRHRYLNVVFPSAPETVTAVTLQLTLEGDRAHGQGTTQIGGEVSPNGDLWELERVDDCWYLVRLTYNLEPLQAGNAQDASTQDEAQPQATF